jgi:uncharacterized protein (DUF433 family)
VATAELHDIAPDDPRRRWGVFSVRDTSKYLGVPPSTVATWVRDDAGLVTRVNGGRPLLPFVGFAEAFALNALRRAGVPMQEIRPALDDLRREMGIEHVLASRNLATDGIRVLFRYSGDEPDHTVVRTKQRQFRKTVEAYLTPIHYGEDGWADRLYLPRYERARVIVDPRKAFGRPLLESGRATVEDIADRFAAGESIGEIAFDFRISPEEVEDVIRVEALASRTGFS